MKKKRFLSQLLKKKKNLNLILLKYIDCIMVHCFDKVNLQTTFNEIFCSMNLLHEISHSQIFILGNVSIFILSTPMNYHNNMSYVQ